MKREQRTVHRRTSSTSLNRLTLFLPASFVRARLLLRARWVLLMDKERMADITTGLRPYLIVPNCDRYIFPHKLLISGILPYFWCQRIITPFPAATTVFAASFAHCMSGIVLCRPRVANDHINQQYALHFIQQRSSLSSVHWTWTEARSGSVCSSLA